MYRCILYRPNFVLVYSLRDLYCIGIFYVSNIAFVYSKRVLSCIGVFHKGLILYWCIS